MLQRSENIEFSSALQLQYDDVARVLTNPFDSVAGANQGREDDTVVNDLESRFERGFPWLAPGFKP